MTNAQIIMNESIRLMDEGVIGGSGIFGTIEDAEGNKREIEFPEAIHTFNTWKSLGRVVKKGEHAKAAFTIWKQGKGKKDDDGEETPGHMFMKTAFFFTIDQTEEVKSDVH